jgi:long-subunit acyl-CoA synthetase (AMP-forming)
MQVGATTLAAEPLLLKEALAAGAGSQALIAVGTDGRLKSFDRDAVLRLAERIGTVIAAAPGRTVLSTLPRTSVFRLATALAATRHDATLLLADPAQRPDSGLDEHPVDAVLSSPEALERLSNAWHADIAGRSWTGRKLVAWSLRQGADPVRAGWKHRVAESLALRDLRRKLGVRITRLDVLREDAAKPEPRVVSFFEAIGLPVRYLYTQGAAKSGPSIASS